MGQYAAIDALDPVRFTQRDKKLLSEALNELAVNGGGSSGGGSTPQTPINAATLQGYSLAQVLRRDNHTGPFYSPKWIPDQRAGLVFTGSPNNNVFRWYIDDSDLAAPTFNVETGGTSFPCDVRFTAGSSGVVMYGRYAGTLCRITCDDTDPTAPILVPTTLASTSSVSIGNDYWLAQGCEIFLRGRTNNSDGQGRWWNVFIDDTQADLYIAIERLSL